MSPSIGDQPDRDLLAACLTPVPGPAGVNPIAELLASEVADVLRDLSANRTGAGKAALPSTLTEGLPALTATALGAVEGTLRSKSLDGALKEAQVVATYEEARERNANAAKLQAEADLARIQAARARLALALEACRAFGVDPVTALGASGSPAVVLGEGLIGTPQLPQIASTAELMEDGQ